MIGRRTSHIALDIGSASVGACQMIHTADGPRVTRQVFVADSLQEPPQRGVGTGPGLARAGRVVAQAAFSGKRVSIALQSPEAVFGLLSVPEAMFAAPETEWNTMLRFEAARQAHSTPEALEVVAWPLPGRGPGGANLFIAAAHLQAIEANRRELARIGLEVARIDLVPLALLRAGWHAGVPGEPDKPDQALWGVLDIGALTCTLMIALGNQCVFVRNLQVSGDTLTQTISQSLEIHYAAAEVLKRDPACSLASADSHDQTASRAHSGISESHATAVQAAVRGKIRSLTADLRRAFTYTLESFADAIPAGLYLAGGAARLPGFATHLQDTLGVPVHVLTPRRALLGLQSPTLGLDSLDEPALSVAVGIALGDLG